MLKIFVIAALCAAFVLFASLVGMIVFSSDQNGSDDQQKPAIAKQSNGENGSSRTNQRAEDDTEKRKSKRNWYDTFIERQTDWLLVLFNGLLVVATIALFVSGERNVTAARDSANAAQKSAEVADRTLRITQRPYVTIIPQISDFQVGRRPKITIVVKNVGTTPAYDITNSLFISFLPHPLPEAVTFNDVLDTPPTKSVLAREASITTVGTISYDLTQDFFDRVIGDHDLRFYAWGRIEFTDPFHDTHFANYCFVYDGRGIRENAPDLCAKHNDSDQ